MKSLQPLIISSLDQLTTLHAELTELQSTEARIYYQAEIIFTSTITEFDGTRGYIYMKEVCLITLLDVVRILRCRRLTFINVIVSIADVFIRHTLADLREVYMQECLAAIPLIRQLIVNCPNLQSFSDTGFEERQVFPQDEQNRLDKMVMTTIAITAALSQNYHLTRFQSLSIESELKAVMQARIKQADRLKLLEYSRTIRSVPLRNVAGLKKCQSAVYQFLLIKRYRRKSVLRIINKDVVNIISRLIYDSRGIAVWCS